MQCVAFSGCFRDFLFITNFQQSDYECALGFFASLSSLLSFLDMCIYSFLSNLKNDLPLLLKMFLHSPPSHSTPTPYSSCCFSFSVAQSCLILCYPMNCSTPGFLVLHCFLEFAQTHVHWVGYGIHLSHPLLLPFPPAFDLSQHQGLFQWVGSSHQVAKVLELQLQHQSFQWIFRTDFL